MIYINNMWPFKKNKIKDISQDYISLPITGISKDEAENALKNMIANYDDPIDNFIDKSTYEILQTLVNDINILHKLNLKLITSLYINYKEYKIILNNNHNLIVFKVVYYLNSEQYTYYFQDRNYSDSNNFYNKYDFIKFIKNEFLVDKIDYLKRLSNVKNEEK